jgi:hemolysin III
VTPNLRLNSEAYRDAEFAVDYSVHVIALATGAVAALAMMVRATVSANLLTLFAVAIYSLALVAMLGASAAHNCGQTRAGKELRRRLDHAAIFVMIAGTYTPFTVRLLPDGMAFAATAGVWISAIAGAFIKLRYPRCFQRLSIVIYLVLGWDGLFLAPSLFASLPQAAVALIITGGVLYSVGMVFHLWMRLPFHNAILARFRRARSRLSLRRDLASRRAGRRQSIIAGLLGMLMLRFWSRLQRLMPSSEWLLSAQERYRHA